MPGEFYIEGKREKLSLKELLALLEELEAKLAAGGGLPYKFWASGPPIIEDDAGVTQRFAIGITTGNGLPLPEKITEGTISIWRMRGTSTQLIVDGAACSKEAGLVYYDHIFALDVWQDGDHYRALFEGQAVNIDTATYDLPPVMVQGYIRSETEVYKGDTSGNWQTTETEVVSIGAAYAVRYRLHSLLLSIHNLVGTQITARMYMKVNDVERKVYEQNFDATTDPPGLWIVNGTVGLHELLRVTIQSNNAADNGKIVDFDYTLEAM
jgi:hypothetical protein